MWFVENESADLSLAKKLHGKSTFYKKEYGLDTSLKVHVFVKWKIPNRDIFFTSPLIYQTCKIVLNRKIETKYELKEESEQLFVNPILVHCFKQYFDINLPQQVEDKSNLIQNLSEQMSSENYEITRSNVLSEGEGWEIIEQIAVGNFNYKKSLLGSDFDHILEYPNQQIENILTGSNQKKPESKKTIGLINSLDESQLIAIDEGQENDLVIQGPPGTGKSHTIVSLIGSYLLEGKKVLFVSEKRSALDVVFERLKENEIHYWAAYFNTEKDEKKTFYAHLKKAWEKANDLNGENPKINEREVHGKEMFQLYPEKLLEPNEKLNTNLYNLTQILLASNLGEKQLNVKGVFPKYADWKIHLEFLKDFELRCKSELKIESLSQGSFTQLSKSVFTEKNPILLLEKKLNEIELTLTKIVELEAKYNWNYSLNEFTRHAISASILAMVNKSQLNLLNVDTKEYKSFGNWSKKYQTLKNKLTQEEQLNSKWKNKPSISEISELQDLIKNDKKPRGILGLLKRNSDKLSDAFKEFDHNLTDVAKLQMLDSLKNEWRLKGELNEVQIKLRHNLNITDPELEIDHILKLRNKLDSVTENEYMQILENENSLEIIKDLEGVHNSIQQLNNLSRFILGGSIPDNIIELQKLIKELKASLPLITQWLPEIQKFFKMPQNVIDFILTNKFSLNHLDAIVAYQNLLEQTRFETRFKDLSGWNLIEEFKLVNNSEKLIFKSNVNHIQNASVAEIKEVEDLLRTPASKLKGDKKDLKKKLKVQKRTIIHELNKKQQHLAVKTLFEEASDLLMKIQPLWMMNPLSVSESLPCDSDLFDVVIFDESSQIPFEDAIPTIYRAKQVIVVGDSNQMPPSQFFSHKTETKTLLDQAEYAYKNQMLKWHYRSEHPALIQFSNQAFYDNELISLPPVDNTPPIELIKLEGIFENSVNKIEAKELALRYGVMLKEGKRDVAIIAFSKEQEKAILKEIQNQKIPNNDVLIIRNLENVQGIEKEYVLISMAYAKNSEGLFRMNFGPVNQENGANRLNVLFTRAIKKMLIFTSVSSSDFKLSENRGVQIMKDFLTYSENLSLRKESPQAIGIAAQRIQDLLGKNNLNVNYYSNNDGIAVNCFVQHSTNKILLVDPGVHNGETKDVYNLISIFNQKYKGLMVVLSIDLWKNGERVVKDVLSFFS